MELAMSRYVWEKIRHLKEYRSCEVGFWGIAADPKRPMVITDAIISKQKCSPVKVDWDEDGLLEFQMAQSKLGIQPFQCMRVWMHTHPKMTPTPSGTDEGTLKNTFSDPDWVVMFILGDDDEVYCRYRDNKNNKSEEIPVVVDLGLENKTSTRKAWEAEYDANVEYNEWVSRSSSSGPVTIGNPTIGASSSYEPNSGKQQQQPSRGGNPYGAYYNSDWDYGYGGDSYDNDEYYQQYSTEYSKYSQKIFGPTKPSQV